MGLQYNVQVLRENGIVDGFSGDFLRENYGFLPLITGMLSERVAQDGWGQLVSVGVAAEFLKKFGAPSHYREFLSGIKGELVRLTIA